MIRPLRYAHRYVWLVIAAVLPAGIFLAWLVIPNAVPVEKLLRQELELLPVIQQQKQSEQYCVNLRSDRAKTAWQLEWKNRMPLTIPSAVIYQTIGDVKDISKMRLIGRIESRGDFVFQLPIEDGSRQPIGLIVYDFIHEKIVDSINFKQPL